MTILQVLSRVPTNAEIWAPIVGQLLTVLGVGIGARYTYLGLKEVAKKADGAATAATNAAVRVEEVKKTAAVSTAGTNAKLDRIERTGHDNHILLNNEKSRMLTVVAVTLRALATRTGDPLDAAAANEAEKDKKNHDSQQAKVDAEQATLGDE